MWHTMKWKVASFHPAAAHVRPRGVHVLAVATPTNPSATPQRPSPFRFIEDEMPRYSFKSLVELSRQHLSMPIDNYIGPVEVRHISEDKGRGLFATEIIRPGQIVLLEKAVVTVRHDVDFVSLSSQEEIRLKLAERLKELLDKDDDEARGLRARILTLYTGPDFPILNYKNAPRSLEQLPDVDGEEMMAMDCSLDRLEQVVKYNSVWIVQQQARGLYYHMCLINHGCYGNVNIVQVGNVVIVRAVRRIAQGEEIQWNYKTGASPPYLENLLQMSHGFSCHDTCTRQCSQLRQLYGADGIQSRKELEEFYNAGDIGLKDFIYGGAKTGFFLNFVLQNALRKWVDKALKSDVSNKVIEKRLLNAYRIGVMSYNKNCCEYAWRLHWFYLNRMKNRQLADKWELIGRRLVDIYIGKDMPVELAF